MANLNVKPKQTQAQQSTPALCTLQRRKSVERSGVVSLLRENVVSTDTDIDRVEPGASVIAKLWESWKRLRIEGDRIYDLDDADENYVTAGIFFDLAEECACRIMERPIASDDDAAIQGLVVNAYAESESITFETFAAQLVENLVARAGRNLPSWRRDFGGISELDIPAERLKSADAPWAEC